MIRSGTYLIAILIGCVVLFFIGQSLIADHAVPSLPDFMASSSEAAQLASSTPANASTTTQNTFANPLGLPTTDIVAPNGTIHVEMASDDASREQGLSDRTSLPADAGMLFSFDKPAEYGFWMKDMHFPLDMIWIASDRSVVGITRNISPDTYPEVIAPTSPVRYVLEVNAFASQKFGIATGTILKF